jgi:hypothetical protein
MADQPPPEERAIPATSAPGILTHGEDDVDVALIRWMLSLTPAERLQVLQDHVDSVLRNPTTASRSYVQEPNVIIEVVSDRLKKRDTAGVPTQK